MHAGEQGQSHKNCRTIDIRRSYMSRYGSGVIDTGKDVSCITTNFLIYTAQTQSRWRCEVGSSVIHLWPEARLVYRSRWIAQCTDQSSKTIICPEPGQTTLTK